MPKLKFAALAGGVLAVLSIKLLTPWSNELFAAHMAQHLILIAVAAPLLVLGGAEIPGPPLASWALFIVVFLFWHWPAAFQWAAQRPLTELLELASILGAAMAFWSGVFKPGLLTAGARALMVMTAAILTDLPGVIMLFASQATCVMPGENAARFGLTPLQDQQIGGLLMWVPANLVFFAIATVLFARWIADGEQHSRANVASAPGANCGPAWR
jgi:putative membrane protein